MLSARLAKIIHDNATIEAQLLKCRYVIYINIFCCLFIDSLFIVKIKETSAQTKWR